MFRTVSWRRLCPEKVSRLIEEALTARYYILHQAGPSGFVLREEQSSKKIKVFLGDPSVCSCSVFKKSHELCQHILWIMLKKFRVPRSNPLVWQLGLVEREIDEIILGFLSKQSADQSKHCNKSHDDTKTVSQRTIESEDVCPICQDKIDSSQPIVYCRFGCGQNIHTKCIKILADHQRTQPGGGPVQCPLCRAEFGAIKSEPSKASQRLHSEKACLHLGVTCAHCHLCPIAGSCFRCSVCVSYYLCEACYSSNEVHLLHSFQSRKHTSQPWRSVSRPSPPHSPSHDLSPTLVSTLQSRSLTESDYELLLQLDSPSVGRSTPPRVGVVRSRGVSERVMNSLHVEPLDGDHPLIVGGANCEVCGQQYLRGDWVRKLPCKHKFHRGCIEEWLFTHTECPIDGNPVHPPPRRSKKRLARRTTRDPTIGHSLLPLTRALTDTPPDRGGGRGTEFTVSGYGISTSKFSHGSQTKETTTHTYSTPSHPHTSTAHQEQQDNRRAKRYSITLSLNSEDPPQALLLTPTVTSSPVHHVTSHDPNKRRTRAGSSHRKTEDYKTVSLPSLGGPTTDPALRRTRQKIVRGSLAGRGGGGLSNTHVSSKVDRVDSLQVGSFKLHPLPPTNSILTVPY